MYTTHKELYFMSEKCFSLLVTKSVSGQNLTQRPLHL